MLGEYTLQLNLGCAREADELYPMPEAAVAVGVYRIGHAAAEFQYQRVLVGVGGGYGQPHGELAGGVQVVVRQYGSAGLGDVVGTAVIDPVRLAVEDDHARPPGWVPFMLTLFFHCNWELLLSDWRAV